MNTQPTRPQLSDYIQAKRWQGSVGRPDIQAFFGALAGRRARKGVFITTSTFTREAREYGDQISESVALLDGAVLTRLLIENGVAATHYRVVRLPRRPRLLRYTVMCQTARMAAPG